MNLLRDILAILRDFVANVGAAALFFLRILGQIPASVLRPRLIARQVHNAGGLSLVIIMTSALVVGMAMGLQLYDVLARFGSSESLGSGSGLALLKEIGPVLTALLFSGRAGTALASEIGLMKATEQLAAMEMMAVDSVRYVVVPRFLGGVISMPLLTAIFIMISLFGVQLIGVQQLGVDEGTFWSQLRGSVNWPDVREGIVKGFVFGVACSLIAVYEGFRGEPTAEGVGRATTRTVVNSAVLVLILDYMLTALMRVNKF
jgi:phospholipid/cholesterol/gamma-HCH transport system permease protein